MLVVMRHAGQRVLIGPDIAVMITAVDGKEVRIGITAPPHVEILREELAARPARKPKGKR